MMKHLILILSMIPLAGIAQVNNDQIVQIAMNDQNISLQQQTDKQGTLQNDPELDCDLCDEIEEAKSKQEADSKTKNIAVHNPARNLSSLKRRFLINRKYIHKNRTLFRKKKRRSGVFCYRFN